ncbi:hypothetical protein Csp1_00190 [Corynebacterium provencense]|uniref:Uncharacterized protein n=1 Tax=Corynebacterium provencense TaxID=1737425 RepID=A0A2Z3YS68_9CORY|nr:hypothetical protein [Corynebacterium provencense]AWT24857.1 hypothetical protein Csp1_00190 [Corynebacterium provencense]
MEAIVVAVIAAGVPFLLRYLGPDWVEEQDQKMQKAAKSLGMIEDAQAIEERRKRRIKSFAYRSRLQSESTFTMWGYMTSLAAFGVLGLTVLTRYCPYPLEIWTGTAFIFFLIFLVSTLRDGNRTVDKTSSTDSEAENSVED